MFLLVESDCLVGKFGEGCGFLEFILSLLWSPLFYPMVACGSYNIRFV
jgi:hypothetical protein